MTITQLIYSDVNKAYRVLVTSPELDRIFCELRASYKLPNSPTSDDFRKADQYALLEIFKK